MYYIPRIRPSLSDTTTTNNTTYNIRQVKPQPLFSFSSYSRGAQLKTKFLPRSILKLRFQLEVLSFTLHGYTYVLYIIRRVCIEKKCTVYLVCHLTVLSSLYSTRFFPGNTISICQLNATQQTASQPMTRGRGLNGGCTRQLRPLGPNLKKSCTMQYILIINKFFIRTDSTTCTSHQASLAAAVGME